jgi:hypothetical protein
MRISNGQSALKTNAVGVRAAMRPGIEATTFANASAPTTMRTIDSVGTLGTGTALI